MKRALALICCFALSLALAGCGSDDENKLVVGATAKPHAEILKVVQPILEKEGIDLEIKEFTDYVLLNPALNDGEIDANFFQHIPYLEDSNEKNKTDLVWTVKVHNEPMGVYSKKFKKIEDLPNDARVPAAFRECRSALTAVPAARLDGSGEVGGYQTEGRRGGDRDGQGYRSKFEKPENSDDGCGHARPQLRRP